MAWHMKRKGVFFCRLAKPEGRVEKSERKGGMPMSVFETLMIMLTFGLVIMAVVNGINTKK